MKSQIKNRYFKLLTLVLAAAVVLAIIPNTSGNGTVIAAESKNANNTCLGTSGIASPAKPDADSPWSGSYVYFGQYNDKPIKFRVLAPITTEYGGTTMFLDSDTAFYESSYSFDSVAWSGSGIREDLNGDFYDNAFNSIEKNAIATSVLAGGKSYPAGSYQEKYFKSTVGLDDKIFLLDASEATNEAYGYASDPGNSAESYFDYHKVSNRIKNKDYGSAGSSENWWLRNVYVSSYGRSPSIVTSDGYFYDYTAIYGSGVAPALNIDASSILFSSLVSGKINAAGSEYKLTLIDDAISVSMQKGKKATLSGRTLSIPFMLTTTDGLQARVSVLILDKEYKSGNTNNAKILTYDTLNEIGEFVIPSSYNLNDWGNKYFVYIIAETVNGGKNTDYASKPLKIDAPAGAATPTDKPTATPTSAKKPTATPTATTKPSGKPTATPTTKPADPTAVPTNKPMTKPTNEPTATPIPTNKPTTKPTATPTPSGERISTWEYFPGEGWIYYDSNGTIVTDWFKIDGSWYYFGESGVMQTGWITNDGKEWYYLGRSGAMVTGWVKTGNIWYYLRTSGVMATGWQKIGGKWYFFDGEGAMMTGWIKTGGKWYYLKFDGSMAFNEYCDGYWLNKDGTWTYEYRAAWKKNSVGWYYIDPSGWYARDCTLMIDSKSYEFNKAGYCVNP